MTTATALLADQLNNALPQTQCTRCGYPNCRAYAQAIALGEAAINQCPPGGAEGVKRLAAITGQRPVALNAAHGAEGPRAVALIDEAWCIGCTLCLAVCPTDAIFGSNKRMHAIIEPWCTGCALCIAVCPVDCISLDNVTAQRTGWAAWSNEAAQTAKKRYEIHRYRTFKDNGQRPESLENSNCDTAEVAEPADKLNPAELAAADAASAALADQKRAVIAAAMARARAQRPSGC